MAGTRKLKSLAQAEVMPPANLWEVLERGQKDTFPIHTALWLFKNAKGDTGAFLHLPGPTFAYRTREPNDNPLCGSNAACTLEVLAWFLCLSTYGRGHLHAGPTATVYGWLSEGFLEPPVTVPTQPGELPKEVRDLLTKATFPLSDLPALSLEQVAFFYAAKSIKYASIFGPLESQLLKRAKFIRQGLYVPADVEKGVKKAMDRAEAAFEMPSRQDWEYDQKRQEHFIRSTRCRRANPVSLSIAHSPRDVPHGRPGSDFSPYSPPYWGLPIFNLRPLWQEALRLIKLVPEKVEQCPSLPFMEPKDWERCHRFRTDRRFSKVKHVGIRSFYPKNSDEAAAWEWIENIYGMRVRPVLYPSDRRLKNCTSSASE